MFSVVVRYILSYRIFTLYHHVSEQLLNQLFTDSKRFWVVDVNWVLTLIIYKTF